MRETMNIAGARFFAVAYDSNIAHAGAGNEALPPGTVSGLYVVVRALIAAATPDVLLARNLSVRWLRPVPEGVTVRYDIERSPLERGRRGYDWRETRIAVVIPGPDGDELAARIVIEQGFARPK